MIGSAFAAKDLSGSEDLVGFWLYGPSICCMPSRLDRAGPFFLLSDFVLV